MDGARTIPPPSHNNLWFRPTASDRAIVFVHGVLSDSASCWLNNRVRPPQYWPQLVADDRRFDPYGIFLAGYYTAIDAGRYDIRNSSDELLGALQRKNEDGTSSASDRKQLIFVCHSTGGIVVRHILVNHTGLFRAKKIGLVLIASPSGGSHWASWLSMVTSFYGHAVGAQLQERSWSLIELDAQFKRLRDEDRIPNLVGVEAYENHFIFHRKWLPNKAVVVTEESAGRYFGPPVLLRKTDHFSSVKPEGKNHPAHELLVDFCQRHFTDQQTGGKIFVSSADSSELAGVIRDGLSLLMVMRNEPIVQQEVGRFHSAFEKITKEIRILECYKALHDGLHELQIKLGAIEDACQRARIDRQGVAALKAYGQELKHLVLRLRREIGAEEDLPTWTQEKKWIDEFEQIIERIEQDLSDPEELESLHNKLKSILKEAFRINSLLAAFASQLNLDRLSTSISSIMQRVDSSAEFQQRLSISSEAVKALWERLSKLVVQHFKWQEIEGLLSVAETAVILQHGIAGWTVLKNKLVNLCQLSPEDYWCRQINSKILEWEQYFREANSENNENDRRRIVFDELHRACVFRFYNIDEELKYLCGQLSDLSIPLRSLLQAVGR